MIQAETFRNAGEMLPPGRLIWNGERGAPPLAGPSGGGGGERGCPRQVA